MRTGSVMTADRDAEQIAYTIDYRLNVDIGDDVPESITRTKRALTADEQALMMKANVLQVDDAESYRIAGETVAALKRLQKTIESYYERGLKPLRIISDVLRQWRTAALAPVEATTKRLDARALAWRNEQRRLERIERERKEAEARRVAEVDRLRRVQELQEQAKAEPDKGMKRALKAEAQAVAATPVTPHAVHVESRVPVAAGYSPRVYYKAKLVDFEALVKAVAEGREPIEALVPNQTFANQRATDQKDMFEMVGYVLEKTDGSASR